MSRFSPSVFLLRKRYSVLGVAFFCSLSLCIFSYTIQFDFPVKLIALIALAAAALFLSAALTDYELDEARFRITGLSSLYIISGFILGILIAIFYRWHLETTLLPQSFHLFVIVAALIGISEEIVFRGVIQDQAKSINAPFSIFFSAIAHTAYKSCLFISPAAFRDINVMFLAFWTFIFGLVFGYIRHRSGSILPSIIAHAIFDVLVYAECMSHPWWVW